MNRIQTACCFLLASAFVLGGLLLVQLAPRVTPSTAEASMVIDRDTFSMLTARSAQDEEAFFFLDNSSATLLAYRLDLSTQELQLSDSLRLNDLFGSRRGSRDRDDDDDDDGRSRSRRDR